MTTHELSDPRHYLHQLERLLEHTLFEGASMSGDLEAAIWLVRLALEGGDDDRAASLVGSIERLAADQPSHAEVSTTAVRARALVERDGATLEHLAGGLSDPWARAAASEDAAVAWAERGERKAAIAQFARARAEYERLNATDDLARCRSRLREAGVRPHHWSYERRPTSGWASLTETERRVAELVSQGLTNRDVARQMFLSRHTVDFHLRHVYWKLGISSRVQLARRFSSSSPGDQQP